MSKLTAIRKQIAALQVEAERITKDEMSAALAKVKDIMSSFGLTVEHLGAAVAGKKRAAFKKAKPTRAGAGTAKYADPKTGKTWSGFGRVPAWIAGAKSRDAFLVDKSGLAASVEPVAKTVAAKKKKSVSKAAASAKKVTGSAAKKAAATAKKAAPAAPAAAKKKPSAKKSTPKTAAKKSAQKRAAASGNAGAPAAAETNAPSGT